MSPLAIFTAIASAIFTFLLLHFLNLLPFTRTTKHGKPAPRAAGAWPITGHLHFLSGSRLPHKILGAMVDTYGPIFTIKLGVHQALAINSAELAKECFTTNDRAFANRPKSMSIELLSYNYASLGFAPYGPYWRALRKITVLELLSTKSMQMLAHVRASEAKLFMKEMYESWESEKGGSKKAVIEMKHWFESMTFNVILRMIAGKRYGPGDVEGDRFKRTVRTFVELLGTVVVSDVIPWLRWLDFGGYSKVMKKTADEMDEIFEGWLDEQMRKMKSGENVEGKDQVFMGALLARFETEVEKDLSGFDTRSIIKATCSTILAAASDTTTVTLTWALALLINNPQTLKKAKQELEIHVGNNRQVEESDLKNLVYLQAILKETMRLYPAGPIIAPHESIEECVVGGYTIPKGTRLLVNIWKIHRNPNVWDEPDEFRPERFLTTHKEMDVWGQNFEYLPFSSGRRICLGTAFALQAMQLLLASLIQGFEMESASGEAIDMTESPGLTNLKATPLEILISPRLSPTLYQG